MTGAAAAPRPRRRDFVSRFKEVRLSREEAERQGRIVQLAHLLLGREEAMRFLNTPNEGIGGRPLDLAIASPDGFSTIATAVQLLARPQSGVMQ